MKQLEFDFNPINLSDYYVQHQVIDEGKNQIFSWSDTLSDDGEKIIYHEYTYNTNQCMDFENWVHINKIGLEKFKRLLNDVKIPFEEGDWQTIDKDCERTKLN